MNKEKIKQNGEYNINSDGNIYNETDEYTIEITGKKPTNGILIFNENELESACITINKYAVTIENGEVTNTVKGNCEYQNIEESIITIAENYAKSVKNTKGNITNIFNVPVERVTSDKVEAGWVALVEGQIDSYSLKIGAYVVTQSNRNATISKTTEIAKITTANTSALAEFLGGEEKNDGAIYITTAKQVYFNPTKGTNGGTCESAEEGCMHWYLYSVKGDYANMLLDHNITEVQSSSGIWVSQTDYEDSTKPATLGITYPGISSFPDYDTVTGTNNKGPITALNTLKTLTTNWKTNTPMVPNSSSTNEYIIPKSQNDNKYQIDYTGYKARLITKEEAEYLGCSGNANSCPEWMIKGTSSENSTTYANIYGYWASTPSYVNSNDGTVINSDRTINKLNPTSTYRGVRPVIAVNINDVL